tara:strand:- start:316 stop:1107 length:792 start_codon:yes stop_codon:yes gene_type:complete
MKILITGYKGLIGQRIYERLKLFHDVTGYGRGYDFDKLKDKKFELIIHCACNNVIRDVVKNPDLAKENIDLTYDIMELARKSECKKVIMFSSGRIRHANRSPYVVGKIFNEEIVKAYKECYGINYIIIRPETVWGMNDKDRVIPLWIRSAIQNKPITVYGNENKELPPVYVDDFVKEFFKIINNFEKHKNKSISIAGKTLRVEEIVRMLREELNSQSEIKYLETETSQPQKCIKPDVSCDEDFRLRVREVVRYHTKEDDMNLE